jgi:hypothetical protein
MAKSRWSLAGTQWSSAGIQKKVFSQGLNCGYAASGATDAQWFPTLAHSLIDKQPKIGHTSTTQKAPNTAPYRTEHRYTALRLFTFRYAGMHNSCQP